jgi:hypothetical protein
MPYCVCVSVRVYAHVPESVFEPESKIRDRTKLSRVKTPLATDSTDKSGEVANYNPY